MVQLLIVRFGLRWRSFINYLKKRKTVQAYVGAGGFKGEIVLDSTYSPEGQTGIKEAG